MKRAPKVGDMLMVGTSTKPMLVVEVDHRVHTDPLRSESYHATTFEVISEDKTGVVNPKTKKYVIKGGSMTIAKHTEVDLEDLYLADHIKVKKQVVSLVKYVRK